jgi:hypothetical protein
MQRDSNIKMAKLEKELKVIKKTCRIPHKDVPVETQL